MLVELTKLDGHDGQSLLVIFVGHDPRVGWLLNWLTRTNRRWYQLPAPTKVPGLSHTEIVACERDGKQRYEPTWALSPIDKTAEAEVIAKIKSKMDTAKVFAGVLAAVLAFAADGVGKLPSDREAAGLVGLSLLGLATVLYLVTMFWYDRLLMPKRFWAAAVPTTRSRRRRFTLKRPPSSSTWVLYQNMQVVWSRCFIPATVSAGAGLALFVGASSYPTGALEWGLLAIIGGILAAAAFAIAIWSRPSLGVQD